MTRRSPRPIAIPALLAIVGLTSAASTAGAQGLATPQGSPQAYAPMSCYCPYPQGYCPFPQGYCAPAPCGPAMGSPQGASPQSATPQGYAPIPYGTPTPYAIRPLGVPMNSLPTSQSPGGYPVAGGKSPG